MTGASRAHRRGFGQRVLITAVAGLAALAATLAAAPALGAAPPRSRLADFLCQRALAPAQREVSIETVMRPLAGTRRMEVRFELLRAPRPTGPFAEVRGAGLGDWITPPDSSLGQRPGDVWNLQHPVFGLSGPAYYRVQATFRWLDGDDHVLGTSTRHTALCYQPELRPRLILRSVVAHGTGRVSQNRYVAVLANTGATATGPFEVRFTPGPQYSTVATLPAHSRINVVFIGPACQVALSPPTVTVDPLHQVLDNLSWRHDSLVARCPGR